MMNKKFFVFIYKKYIISTDTYIYIYLNIFSLLNIKQKNKNKKWTKLKVVSNALEHYYFFI